MSRSVASHFRVAMALCSARHLCALCTSPFPSIRSALDSHASSLVPDPPPFLLPFLSSFGDTTARTPASSSGPLSSPQITPSPPTDEPSFTRATGSHSYAPNTGEMGMRKKSKDQGYFIEANGGEAIHQRWMRWGCDTQTVHAMEIRSKTWRASCASGGGGNKGE